MTEERQQGRRWPWKTVGLSLLLAFVLLAWNWQLLTIWWSTPVWRHSPLPAFDASKAQTLSAQRRAELERELFSELWMWNIQSRRYQEPDSLGKRRQRWLEMSAEGYELAHLTLQVLDPGDPPHNPLPVFKRLEELAQQGDAGAMCLYGGIAFQLPSWAVDWTPQRKRAREWMEKGAQLGHPQCLIALGGRLTAGTEGYPKDVKRGSEMIFDAIRRGYVHGAGALWINFFDRGLGSSQNRRLVYCWGYHAAKVRAADADLILGVNAQTDAPPEQRPALEHELNLLREWHPSVDECIDLSKQVLGD